MARTSEKTVMLKKRSARVRRKVCGTTERPRLRVTRTARHIYAQLIDDGCGRTIAAASSLGLKISGGNIEAAKQVGKAIGEAAQQLSIAAVCFDRGGRLYHGRIKALADAARETGLNF
jgi:large subunit ribosomal protein L18